MHYKWRCKMKKSNEEKRVVIYCRESRDDYGENYERIETQRDLLIKYCKGHGYTNIIDIIMDDDKSGTDFSRFDDIRAVSYTHLVSKNMGDFIFLVITFLRVQQENRSR